jgi:hypothetical protein
MREAGFMDSAEPDDRYENVPGNLTERVPGGQPGLYASIDDEKALMEDKLDHL